VKKRRLIETSEDLVRALAELFAEDVPKTPEEVDAELREAGYDPEEIGARMQAAAERALATSPLNWRIQAQKELEEERAQMAEFAATPVHDRASIIAAIKQLSSQLGGQVVYAYRNLESETDEDLASLLADLEYLASQQRKNSEG
jgi:hypothetical protein